MNYYLVFYDPDCKNPYLPRAGLSGFDPSSMYYLFIRDQHPFYFCTSPSSYNHSRQKLIYIDVTFPELSQEDWPVFLPVSRIPIPTIRVSYDVPTVMSTDIFINDIFNRMLDPYTSRNASVTPSAIPGLPTSFKPIFPLSVSDVSQALQGFYFLRAYSHPLDDVPPDSNDFVIDLLYKSKPSITFASSKPSFTTSRLLWSYANFQNLSSPSSKIYIPI